MLCPLDRLPTDDGHVHSAVDVAEWDLDTVPVTDRPGSWALGLWLAAVAAAFVGGALVGVTL